MKQSLKLTLGLTLLWMIVHTGCTSTGTQVTILPNASGLAVADQRQHESEKLGESIGIPTGTVVHLKPIKALDPSYYGTLKVIRVDGDSDDRSIRILHAWQGLIAAHLQGAKARDILYQHQLEEIPWINADRGVHAKLQHHTFPWGKAVLFITNYAQGRRDGPVDNSELILTVQGFTDDGRYAVNGHFQIGHPGLANSYRNIDEVNMEKGKSDRHAERFLDRQMNESFTPAIGDYITLLGALRIQSPGEPVTR